MAIQNPGFEDFDPAATGFPDLWTVTTTDAYLRAGFGDGGVPAAGAIPYDSFEGGWRNDDFLVEIPPLGAGLVTAVFSVNQGRETFDIGWDHGLLEFVTGSPAAFSPGGKLAEDFEDDYDIDDYDIVVGPLTSAVFSPGGKLVEDFEADYGVTLYETAFVPVGGQPFRDVFESAVGDRTMVVVPATDDIVVIGHGIGIGARVFFSNLGGRLPSGLLSNVPYFVVQVVNADAIRVSAVSGGTVTDIIDTGFGTHFLGLDPLVFWTDVGFV